MERDKPQAEVHTHPEFFRPRIEWSVWGRWHNQAIDRGMKPKEMLLAAMKEYLENHPRKKGKHD